MLGLTIRNLLRRRNIATSLCKYERILLSSSATCGPPKRPKAKTKDYENFLKKCRIFQCPNDLPIYLKGGAKNQLLFRLTVLLSLIGLVLNFKLYFGYILF